MIFMLFGNIMIDPLKISSNPFYLRYWLQFFMLANCLVLTLFLKQAYRYIPTLYRKYKLSLITPSVNGGLLNHRNLLIIKKE